MLNRAIPPAMMISTAFPGIVLIDVPAITGQYIVVVKNRHIVMNVAASASPRRASFKSPGIGGASSGRQTGIEGVFAFGQRRGCNDDKEIVLAGGKIREQAVINRLGIGDRVFPVVGLGKRRVLRIAVEIGVGKAGLERN